MSSKDRKSKEPKKKRSSLKENPDRRTVLKGAVVISGSVVGSALVLPKKWSRPIVDAIVVPAQAAGLSPGVPTPAPTGAPTLIPPTAPPTQSPTSGPTSFPSFAPTTVPTSAPTTAPTFAPTMAPTFV